MGLCLKYIFLNNWKSMKNQISYFFQKARVRFKILMKFIFKKLNLFQKNII